MIKAKTLLKDKFWIVEENNEKVGTLSFNDDRYLFTDGKKTIFFDNKRQLKKNFGLDISYSDTITDINTDIANEVHGFPTSTTPFNSMYDVKRKLPLYTKSEKSKSLYCAGFYVIKFDKGWVKSFCPKLITIDRYNSKGPFKTEIEMRQELSRVNK